MNKLDSNFGYTKVTSKQKTKLVQEVFSKVSKKYDLMNDLMSLGTHRLWKKEFVNIINPLDNEKIIDIGSGTGDIAKNILKKNFKGELHLLDLNINMLEIGKTTINQNKNLFFHQGNAENLNFKNNSFDKYIIAFCLRNITDIEKSLEEALRILKPGGSYFSLEFSTPYSELTSRLYNSYRNIALPFIGEKVTNNKKAYNYLNESISLFPNQKKLQLTLEKIGFKNVSYINLFDGIIAIHKGYKI
tara:strand:- start:452 stop:1186 length:735 start_codon:yes stop_codon:yes gene_type:complete